MGGRRRAAAVAVVTGAALASAAAPAAAASCSQTAGTWTCTFEATGTEEQFMVPAGVSKLKVDAEGADGGTGDRAAAGGRGARVNAELSVAPAQVLYVNVGGAPTGASGCYLGTTCIGGFNGGGSSVYGGGGGGASDVRTVSRSQPGTLPSRLVVAGGGGGGGMHGSCVLPPIHPAGGPGGDAPMAGSPGGPCATTGGGSGGGGGTGDPGQGGGGETGGGGGGGYNGGGGGGERVLANLTFGAWSAGGGGGGGSNFAAGPWVAAPSRSGPAGRVTISYADPACDGALEARGCWSLDEQGGTTALDSSPFASEGTYVGGPLLGVSGVVGSAVSMDGFDDHVRVPDSANLDVGDSFTLEGWIKRDTERYTHQLFNKGGGGFQLLVMDHFNDNRVWLRKAGASTIVRAGSVPADGRFHHVVATKDGPNSAQIYLDGVQQALEVVSGVQVIQDTTSPLFFSATKSGNPVAGDVDEFAVFDRALTPAEVGARFQRGGLAVPSASARTMSTGAAAPSRTGRAGGDGSRPAAPSACADLDGPESGVTAIRAAGISCADAEQLIRGGAKRRQAAGLDCRITREDFSGRVVRITHECTSIEGRRLGYTTLS